MKTNVSIVLDKGLINRLREQAQTEDRSVSSIIRQASRFYLERFNKPKTQNQK
jgi:predicted transcriptional regulator